MNRTWGYLAGGGALLLAGIVVTELVDRQGPPTLAAPSSTLPAQVSTAAKGGTAPDASDGAARLAAAEAEIVRLTDALAAAKAENAELRATIALRDTVLDTLKASVAERDASLGDLRSRLAANEAELSRLTGRLGGLAAPADFDAALAALKLDAGGPSVARISPAAADGGFASDGNGAAAMTAAVAEGPMVEVQFDFASSALTPGGQERAAVAAATLSGMALAQVRIVGHTDRVGRPEANRRLAARRADAVARYLIASGLPAEIIVTDDAGEAGAPITTDDGVAEPLNRSVLIFAQAKPTT
ncbi:MAG: OmpA family protein [Amaricoccus sp.]|uniref:OmpA family protein n=1 Tax=Amaricoccus sp. TaxID=1872485 RepID=UPI0039E3DA7B